MFMFSAKLDALSAAGRPARPRLTAVQLLAAHALTGSRSFRCAEEVAGECGYLVRAVLKLINPVEHRLAAFGLLPCA